MSVGPTQTERTHARASHAHVRRKTPITQLTLNQHRRVGEIDQRVRFSEVKRRKYFLMLERQDSLRQTCDTSRTNEMSGVCLNRTDPASRLQLRSARERVVNAFDLDRIAEFCSSAVCLDVGNRFRLDRRSFPRCE